MDYGQGGRRQVEGDHTEVIYNFPVITSNEMRLPDSGDA